MQVNCLSVYIHGQKIGIPIDCVDHINEYDLTPPPPLSQELVSGLGVHQGQIFVAVALSQRTDSTANHVAHCVVVKKGESRYRWALEVERIGELEALQVNASPTQPDENIPGLPDWLLPAQDQKGGGVAFLRPQDVVRHLDSVCTPELV